MVYFYLKELRNILKRRSLSGLKKHELKKLSKKKIVLWDRSKLRWILTDKAKKTLQRFLGEDDRQIIHARAHKKIDEAPQRVRGLLRHFQNMMNVAKKMFFIAQD